MVSCYHVLWRAKRAPAADGEKVFQNAFDDGSEVAVTDAAMRDPELDIAAARLLVPASARTLGIGALFGARAAVPGLSVRGARD
jgi:hypothetical protein